MTYFPAATTPTTVKVAKYREALRFAEYICNKVEHPGCRIDEVIQERSHGLLSLFIAMQELQALHCKRKSADDKERYELVIAKATRLVDQYKDQYFKNPEKLSSNSTSQEIYDNWIGSPMADRLTYLMQPHLYPDQAAAALQFLKAEIANRTQTTRTQKRHLRIV